MSECSDRQFRYMRALIDKYFELGRQVYQNDPVAYSSLCSQMSSWHKARNSGRKPSMRRAGELIGEYKERVEVLKKLHDPSHYPNYGAANQARANFRPKVIGPPL